MQFDRRELGVELVKDVDVMPIDPTENLPSIFTPMMVRAVPFYSTLVTVFLSPLVILKLTWV